MKRKVHPKILTLARQVRGKRAKAVIGLILKHGQVTTEELERIGYIHPPRAVRDVREHGIPIETIRVKGKNGKSIAAYKFGNPAEIQDFKLGGRTTFPKDFKLKLYKKQGKKCAICNEEYDERFFQIDHRIPYELFGDRGGALRLRDFMLLCATCNRKKDRATETGCKRTCFQSGDLKTMRSCFWASPENYSHICMEPVRRAEVVWRGNEVEDYNRVRRKARAQRLPVNVYIKKLLKESGG